MKTEHFGRTLGRVPRELAGVQRKIYSLRTGKDIERAVGGRMVSGGGSSYSPDIAHAYIYVKTDTTPAKLTSNRPVDNVSRPRNL